jgi:phosphohistidine phosphatase
MSTLLLLRHGKSSWKDPTLADHDRPLKKRGRRDAPRMGMLVADLGLVPDVIVTSSAERALRTAELVAEAAGFEGEMIVTEALYHADPDDYMSALRAYGRDAACVMLVGHNPGLEMLLEELTGDWERLPTAALAQVSLPDAPWFGVGAETPGVLVGLWRPREIG